MQEHKNSKDKNTDINPDKDISLNREASKSDTEKFMINWAENEPPEHFSGDEQTDDFTVDNDYNKNVDLRMNSLMGGTFMHPMHDATLDAYNNEVDSEAKKDKNEKK